MKKISKTIFLILSVVFIFSFKSSAWNGETHKLLTEYAVKNSTLGNINLCQKLNLDKGIYQELLTIKNWPIDSFRSVNRYRTGKKSQAQTIDFHEFSN